MNTNTLIRWAGIPAIAAGVIFAVIQPIHPPDVLASVTTDAWLIIQSLKTVMCVLFLVGITGLYTRQAKTMGWLGLVGFVLFSLNWVLQLPFIFTEAFVLPSLATESPKFVESFLGIVNESTIEMNLGALPSLYVLAGGVYMLGSLLFGIATVRARILPRAAALLLSLAGPLAVVLVSLLPHQFERLAAVPMGFAMIWLGYALWRERLAKSADRVTNIAQPELRQSNAG